MESRPGLLALCGSYYIDSVGSITKNWIRATMIVVARDDESNVTQLVFSFQEIGDIIEQQK